MPPLPLPASVAATMQSEPVVGPGFDVSEALKRANDYLHFMGHQCTSDREFNEKHGHGTVLVAANWNGNCERPAFLLTIHNASSHEMLLFLRGTSSKQDVCTHYVRVSECFAVGLRSAIT